MGCILDCAYVGRIINTNHYPNDAVIILKDNKDGTYKYLVSSKDFEIVKPHVILINEAGYIIDSDGICDLSKKDFVGLFVQDDEFKSEMLYIFSIASEDMSNTINELQSHYDGLRNSRIYQSITMLGDTIEALKNYKRTYD